MLYKIISSVYSDFAFISDGVFSNYITSRLQFPSSPSVNLF